MTTPDPEMSVETTEIQETQEPKETNYRKLYRDKCAELKASEAKCAELEHICKAMAEQKAQAETQLKQTVLEYETKIQFMLDACKHAYVSMQLAVAKPNGGK